MHENEGLETYQVRKNLIELENHLGKRFGERKSVSREVKRHFYQERDREK